MADLMTGGKAIRLNWCWTWT